MVLHIQKFACKFNIRLQTSDSRLEPLCGSTAKGVLHATCDTPFFYYIWNTPMNPAANTVMMLRIHR